MTSIAETVRKGDPLASTPFIDVHGHFGPWTQTTIPHSMDGEKVIGEMDRWGCDMVWMSASTPGHAGDLSLKNDTVFDFAEQYPERILPYCTLSANCPDRNVGELERCLNRGRCIGVKMHTYDQPAYTLKSDFLQPVLKILNERRLVYLNHELGDREALRWALETFPEITFMEGHFNPSINDLCLVHPNLKDCTCAAHGFKAIEKEVKRLGRSDTMLVGSDFGLFQLGFGLGAVAYADLPEDDKEAIAGGNAVELMKKAGLWKSGG
jgi:predicted TIM-barrel fold metal-dependent hydrolase